MNESEMGNRGSKSSTNLNDPQANKLGFVFVKEQRVDGSCTKLVQPNNRADH